MYTFPKLNKEIPLPRPIAHSSMITNLQTDYKAGYISKNIIIMLKYGCV